MTSEQKLISNIAAAAYWLKDRPGAPPIERLAYLVSNDEWDQLAAWAQTYSPQYHPEQEPVTQLSIAGMEVRRAIKR